MPRAAKVISIEAVRRLAAGLTSFGEETAVALDELDVQVRRSVSWIQDDRKEYWTGQVRTGFDRVTQARTDLEHARTVRRIAEHMPACREEKMNLDQAKRRLATAQEKVQAVRRWSHVVEHAATELQGAVAQLADWLQADLPRALAALERMSETLETYAAVSHAPATAPAGQPSTEERHDDENVGPGLAGSQAETGDEDPQGSSGGSD